MRTTPLLLIAALSAGTGLAAQASPEEESERAFPAQRVIVLLRDANGAAWPGATIHVHGAPGVDLLRTGESWHLEADAGPRGKARIQLAERIPFRIWATERLEGNRYRCSTVLEQQRGDAPIRLDALPERGRVSLRVQGLANWAAESPFFVEQHIGEMRAFIARQKLPESGECLLEPFPGDSCRVRVCGSSGLVLGTTEIRASGVDAPKHELQVDAPRWLRIEFTGKDAEQLEDIQVESGDYSSLGEPCWTPLTLDRDGTRVDVRIPLPESRYGRAALRIRAKGRAWFHRRNSWRKLPTKRLTRSVSPHVRVRLHEGLSVRGRLLLGPDRPAVSMPVLALDTDTRRATRTTTDAEGRFQFDHVEPRRSLRLVTWLSGPQRAKLGKERGQLVEPLAFLAVVRATQQDVDLSGIRLDRLVELSLRFLAADGRPARNPRVAFGAHRSRGGIYRPLVVRANRRGRLTLLVPPEGSLELAAALNGALVGAAIRPDDAGADRHLARVVQLPRSLILRGIVRDKNDEPLPGALVYVNARSRINSPGMRFFHSLQGNRTHSDEDGRFEIRLPFRECQYSLRAQYRSGSRTYGSPATYVTVGDRAPDPAELTIPCEAPKK